ncbi:MAG: hypothetical protein HUU47_00230 [Bacteroidetes bacterium]|nr:hypothetical protein [Bacteroidota bacterium]
MFIKFILKILLNLTFFIICGNVSAFEKNVIKSLNFKLYYSKGGEKTAKEIITYSENNLGNIENFLGTRLVEKIDIFLIESTNTKSLQLNQRNGTILLTNSEIIIVYNGDIINAFFQLKKQLSEILIYNMLYGNTIKDRLKNNREVNIQNWFVKGLALFIANKNELNTGKLADYFENRIKLNFNLISDKETEEIGFSIVKFLNDTFGSVKLKQILFYTRLSGNTDFAFKVVLNKSSEKIIEKWFNSEKYHYLQNNKLRLPNEPEPISSKLKSSEIIDIKFDKNTQNLCFLIKSEYGVEIYSYNFEKKVSNRIFKLNVPSNEYNYNFCIVGYKILLSQSDGITSKIMVVESEKKIKKHNLDFSNIFKILEYKGGIMVLAQKNYKTELYFINDINKSETVNVFNLDFDINDFVVCENLDVYVVSILNEKYCLMNLNNKKIIYSSTNKITDLNLYSDSFLSFLSYSNGINAGKIINKKDTSQHFRVTNYNRSISNYDYNSRLNIVAEMINYDKKNYIVISDATIKEIYIDEKDTIKFVKNTLTDSEDSIANIDTLKYFITGFEYKREEKIQTKNETFSRIPFHLKLKEYKIDKFEFKPWYMKLGFSNDMYQSKEFAYFFPKNQGLNNGVNVIVGCGIIEIYKKISFEGNIRQPLRNKGLDIDLAFVRNNQNSSYGIKFFINNFQEDLYNSPEKFISGELKSFYNNKLNHKINNHIEIGTRHDRRIFTSVSEENINKNEINIIKPFISNITDFEIYKKNNLNYKNSLNYSLIFKVSKPISSSGFNNIIKMKLQHNQTIYRILNVSFSVVFTTSPSKQKTVFIMGGQSNWLKPYFGNAKIYDSAHTLMFSAIEDFEGFPYNYQTGTSYNINKLKILLPLNPILSFYSFNQNLFKYLCLKGVLNLGTVWYGKNPFSITNPENRTVIETGSMTIINYTYKNPLIWSWCAGINSVLLGYNFGIDYSIGYTERGKTNKFLSFTLGKEI